ncbi:efflux RND transporter permease subunit, partial [Bacteroidota bacterium]
QSQFIKTSVNNIKKALIEGSIFVVIILFLFLLNGRITIISLLAIPISLLVSVLFLKFIGITINTMTLGGMTIAIGSLVDDAIIDVENVFKRLKENVSRPKAERKNSIVVIYDASREIRSSILNATIIIIVAFIPLFFLSGMEGRMLRPLGISYIVALGASLLVALTLTPVLCSVLLTDEKRLKKQVKGSWVERNLRKWYFSGLNVVMRYKKIVIATSIALFAFTLVLFFSFGRDFLPPFNEGALTISSSTLPGISLEESNLIGHKAETVLLEFPEISKVARRTGRAELSEHTFSVNVSELDVPFELIDRSKNVFLEDLRVELNSIAGVNFEVGQPITHRINNMLSGSKAAIAIKLFGSDLQNLYRIANEIKDNIQDVEGIGDLNVEQLVEIPQIRIKPKRTMLARYGITINEFNDFISYAFGGEKVSEVFENEKAFELVLRFDDQYRNNFEAIKNALIDTHDGQKIPLYYVADVISTTSPNTINRENIQRKIVISVNPAARDLGSLISDIQSRIENNITLPENYRIEYGGQFKSAENASKTLVFASLFAILVIFMILYQEFKSSKIAGVILLNLPLALIGGIVAIWFSSSIISIPAIIGFITLFGIATRNGILLVSRYQHLREDGVKLYDSIIKGSLDRLNPILMTALTAALALIPLAMAGGKPGNEIQSPMAIVILGGLLSSTLLNIFVVPVIYYLINHKKSV